MTDEVSCRMPVVEMNVETRGRKKSLELPFFVHFFSQNSDLVN